MSMEKKCYLRPTVRVVKLDSASIIATSQTFENQQNESYEEVGQSTTDSWFY